MARKLDRLVAARVHAPGSTVKKPAPPPWTESLVTELCRRVSATGGEGVVQAQGFRIVVRRVTVPEVRFAWTVSALRRDGGTTVAGSCSAVEDACVEACRALESCASTAGAPPLTGRALMDRLHELAQRNQPAPSTDEDERRKRNP